MLITLLYIQTKTQGNRTQFRNNTEISADNLVVHQNYKLFLPVLCTRLRTLANLHFSFARGGKSFANLLRSFS